MADTWKLPVWLLAGFQWLLGRWLLSDALRCGDLERWRPQHLPAPTLCVCTCLLPVCQYETWQEQVAWLRRQQVACSDSMLSDGARGAAGQQQ